MHGTSFTGAAGRPQASNDGTNYVNLTGVREDTGAGFNGIIGSSPCSIISNIGGWAFIRFNLTAITGGTITVRGDTGASFQLPLGTTPISLESVGQTFTSSSANAVTVGPNGTTNPTLQVDASAGSAATRPHPTLHRHLTPHWDPFDGADRFDDVMLNAGSALHRVALEILFCGLQRWVTRRLPHWAIAHWAAPAAKPCRAPVGWT